MNKTIIGIDISKHKFDVAYCTSNQKWKDKSFENSPIGFKSCLWWLSDHRIQDMHAVMEATGRYGEDLAHFLYVDAGSGFELPTVRRTNRVVILSALVLTVVTWVYALLLPSALLHH